MSKKNPCTNTGVPPSTNYLDGGPAIPAYKYRNPWVIGIVSGVIVVAIIIGMMYLKHRSLIARAKSYDGVQWVQNGEIINTDEELFIPLRPLSPSSGLYPDTFTLPAKHPSAASFSQGHTPDNIVTTKYSQGELYSPGVDLCHVETHLEFTTAPPSSR